MMGFYGHGFGMIFWMVLLWVVVLGVAIWLLIRLFPSIGSAPPRGSGEPRNATADPALEVLRQRYARGEITREQYEEMRQTLRG